VRQCIGANLLSLAQCDKHSPPPRPGLTPPSRGPAFGRPLTSNVKRQKTRACVLQRFAARWLTGRVASVGQPHAATRSVLMGSVFGSVFGSLAAGIALRAVVRLLAFVAEATGVSKISSMGVSLGAGFYVFPCLSRLCPWPLSSHPQARVLCPYRPNGLCHREATRARGHQHRRERAMSSCLPPNPSVKGTSRRRAAPYVER
jgi:hypothetical protein